MINNLHEFIDELNSFQEVLRLETWNFTFRAKCSVTYSSKLRNDALEIIQHDSYLKVEPNDIDFPLKTHLTIIISLIFGHQNN